MGKEMCSKTGAQSITSGLKRQAVCGEMKKRTREATNKGSLSSAQLDDWFRKEVLRGLGRWLSG